jgi:hypothetical protein
MHRKDIKIGMYVKHYAGVCGEVVGINNHYQYGSMLYEILHDGRVYNTFSSHLKPMTDLEILKYKLCSPKTNSF